MMNIKKIVAAFKDSRGEIFDLFDGEGICHVGLITSKKGTIRGKHYHKTSFQYTYVLSGKIKWSTRDSRRPNSKVETRILEPGDLAIDLPFISHKMIAIKSSKIIYFSSAKRSKGAFETDTVRVDDF